jgi:hypothetical protein
METKGVHVQEDGVVLENAGPTRFVTLTHFWACKLFALSASLRRKVTNMGEVADYYSWVTEHFGDVRPVRYREELWSMMSRRLSPGTARGIEFGVAWGYGTSWWLRHITDEGLRWDGFDRFTGLPRSWRDLPLGHFDTDGKPPAIADNRVTWHVGDVEERLTDLNLDRDPSSQFVILFDLDVFEPSLAAWQHICGNLRPGDLLYFDEAFDRDERHLLDHFVLPSGRFEYVGSTPLALALAVQEIY